MAPLRPTYKQESAAIVRNLLEPIQEVVESDESVVIASFLLIAKDTLRAKGDMGIGPYMLRRAIDRCAAILALVEQVLGQLVGSLPRVMEN